MKINLPDELIFLANRNTKQKEYDGTLENKICVISGGTSGVGREALKQFAMRKAHIVLVCRNNDKGEIIRQEISSAYDIQIDLINADFSDLSQVRNAGQMILDQYPRVDVLVSSVGIHSTKKKHSYDGHELVFAVNHLGPFLFTQMLIPQLLKSEQGRIIDVNSEGHRFNSLDTDDLKWKKRHYTGLRGYGAAKTAQLMTDFELAKRLKDTNITLNAMHPGDVRTGIGRNNGWLYNFYLHNILWQFLKDPQISGKAIAYLATSPELTATTGEFFHLTIPEKPAKHIFNGKTSVAIWDISVDLTRPNVHCFL